MTAESKTVTVKEGTLCPTCGAGPFQPAGLGAHMHAKHGKQSANGKRSAQAAKRRASATKASILLKGATIEIQLTPKQTRELLLDHPEAMADALTS